MAKARFTTTRTISYDDEFDLEPCLALLRGDTIDDDELEPNPRVATATVVDDEDEYEDYDDGEDEYEDQYDAENEPDDSDSDYEDDE